MHRANTLIWDGPTPAKQQGQSFAKPTVRQVVKTTEADLSFNAKHGTHTIQCVAPRSNRLSGEVVLCVVFMYVRHGPHASVSAVCVPPREREDASVNIL